VSADLRHAENNSLIEPSSYQAAQLKAPARVRAVVRGSDCLRRTKLDSGGCRTGRLIPLSALVDEGVAAGETGDNVVVGSFFRFIAVCQ
jgi:hypothetical protein